MTDQITLRGLRGRGRHGVYPDERAGGQDFVVDVSITVDTRAAAAADTLARTVDYAEVAQRALAVVGGEPVALLETLAARIADACLAATGAAQVEQVEVTVHKPQAPLGVPFDDVAVTIVRRPP